MNHFSRVTVIYNPTKDFKKVESYMRRARERNGNIQFEVLRTESFEDIERKAHLAISEGCDVCVAAGGDGTVLGVMNAALKHDTLFTILPLGTGNDLAVSLGIAGGEDAANALFSGTVKNVDAGVCRYRSDGGHEKEMYFCSTAGVGALARVFSYERHGITRMLKSILGNGVWPLLTVVSLFTNKNCATELILNNMKITTQLKLFEVSKVRSAGGTVFAPYAGLENGIFDAWMIHDANSFQALDVFMKAGGPGAKHLSCSALSYFNGDRALNRYGCEKLTEIAIAPEKSLPVHLHGDRVGQTPCWIKILPKRIKVLS